MQALNAQEIAAYRQDGIVVPRQGLAPRTVAMLQAKLDSFLKEQGIIDADYVPDIIERDASWLAIGVMPEILDAVAQLIGEDVIIWGSALFCKAGKGGAGHALASGRALLADPPVADGHRVDRD